MGGEALAIVQDWCAHLRTVLLWGDEGPLFPATRVAVEAWLAALDPMAGAFNIAEP